MYKGGLIYYNVNINDYVVNKEYFNREENKKQNIKWE